MGQYPRPRPKHLAAKLLAIRQRLGLSQSRMAHLLNAQVSSARVCEYESDIREPSLLTLLAYARAANIPVEKIIDDKIELDPCGTW
jgi:transcriptional regulator with XRE-family HTH domain